MDHVLQAVDELNAFYHASPVELAPGTVLKARRREHVPFKSADGVSYEALVEAHRPSWEVPRDEAVYSTQTKEALSTLAPHGKYVYEVEPIGHVTAADFDWFAELMAEYKIRGNPDAERYARNYWLSACSDKGRPCTPNSRTLEFLSPALRVLHEDVEAVGYQPKRMPALGSTERMEDQRWVRGVGVVTKKAKPKRPR